MQLLMMPRDVLDVLQSEGNTDFLLARPTTDKKNFLVDIVNKKPPQKPSKSFVGVHKSRALSYKSYDFTFDPQTLQVQKFSKMFPCDQLLIVEDRVLYDHLIKLDSPTKFASHSEPRQEPQPKKTEAPKSYLEQHSALVKLTLIWKSLGLNKRLLFVLLLDTLLGAWFGHYICDWWPRAVEEAIPKARRIVEWLSYGTPLGLKLNPQVNHALATLFTIHVNMWIIYADVMLPALQTLTDAFKQMAFVPLTLQCALVCDIITLSTVHVYCFYGYMCNIYAVWLSALFALLRIFRGLKYNPLRQRVDTLTDPDPVLLGPIILPIVVFLLPTVFIYYVMFSIMRCTVLLVNFTFGTLLHDFFVMTFNIVTTLSNDWELNLRRTEIQRINEFALCAKPSYSRGTWKAFTQGIAKIFRIRELLSFLRDLCVGTIVFPL